MGRFGSRGSNLDLFRDLQERTTSWPNRGVKKGTCHKALAAPLNQRAKKMQMRGFQLGTRKITEDGMETGEGRKNSLMKLFTLFMIKCYWVKCYTVSLNEPTN